MSPVQLSVRVEGDDQVRAGLNRWAKTISPVTREIVQARMKKALKKSIPWLGGNAYGVPERGYRRTGNLGGSSYIVQEGLSTRIVTEAYNYRGREYSKYVVGDAEGNGQSYVHDGWWVKLRTAVDAEVDELTGEVDQALQDSAEAAGL